MGELPRSGGVEPHLDGVALPQLLPLFRQGTGESGVKNGGHPLAQLDVMGGIKGVHGEPPSFYDGFQ